MLVRFKLHIQMQMKLQVPLLCLLAYVSVSLQHKGDGDDLQALVVEEGGLIHRDDTHSRNVVLEHVVDAQMAETFDVCNDDDSSVPYKHDCPKKDSILKSGYCEEACEDAETKKLMLALGGKEGSCADSGFQIGGGIMCGGVHNITVFAPAATSKLPSAGSFKAASDCDPHYVIEHDLCEMLCVGTKPGTAQFAEAEGLKKGLCPDGYPQYVGMFRAKLLVNVLAATSPSNQ